MSINVNNLSKAELAKLALKNNSQQTQTANKPSFMTSNGSLFNAPGASGIKTDNQKFDAKDLEKVSQINNAADGRAAAASAGEIQNGTKVYTKETEDNTKQSDKLKKDAAKLDKQIGQDDKKFTKTNLKFEATLTKNNQEITKLIKSADESSQNVNDLMKEYESLTGGDKTGVGTSSAFSLQLGGQQPTGTRGAGNEDPNADRLKELESQIDSHVKLSDGYGNRITTLQQSSGRVAKQRNANVNSYIKTTNVRQGQLEENKSTNEKIIDTANKVEEIATMTKEVGTTVNYAGRGLVVLSSASFIAPPVAAALATTGGIMQKVGTTTELVGNYGIAAANVTKSVAYAADGNLAGALQSAGTAVMSGAAAVKGTKEFSKNMDAIDGQVAGAKEKITANAAAKETVKEMKESGDLKAVMDETGMSKKQIKQGISANMQEGLDGSEITAGNINGKVDELKAGAQTTYNTDGSVKNLGYIDQTQGDWTAAGGNNNLAGKAKKEVTNKYNTTLAEKTGSSAANNTGVNAGKLSGAFTAMGSQPAQNNPQQTTTSTGRKGTATYDTRTGARAQQILAKSQKRRAGMYA